MVSYILKDTHVINGTDRTITKHDDAVLLADGPRLQFISRGSVEGLRRWGHVRNVCDSLLDDLQECGELVSLAFKLKWFPTEAELCHPRNCWNTC